MDVMMFGRSWREARVYECMWGSPQRHDGKVKGRHMIQYARRIRMGVKRVDEEGVVLWPRMVFILNEGKLGFAKTAKVVDSSERALPKHILQGHLAHKMLRDSERLQQLQHQFAN